MENFSHTEKLKIKYAMRNQIMKIFACLLIPVVLYIDVFLHDMQNALNTYITQKSKYTAAESNTANRFRHHRIIFL